MNNDPFFIMQLKLQKLIQRYNDLSFFLTKRIETLCREKVGQMKSVLRFFSMNSFLASCSNTERK